MKTLILSLIIYVSVFPQIETAKILTAADSVYDVYSTEEWVQIEVYDSGAADTITVWYPYTTIAGITYYSAVGAITEVATNNIVTGLYGSADMKSYVISLPHPRAIRFLLSNYPSGNVEIKASDKP